MKKIERFTMIETKGEGRRLIVTLDTTFEHCRIQKRERERDKKILSWILLLRFVFGSLSRLFCLSVVCVRRKKAAKLVGWLVEFFILSIH